jgi:hypothetical protein
VPATIKGDRLDEPDELVLVSYTNPTNATIGVHYGFGIATITDDDPPPVIRPGSVAVVEGNSGTKVIIVPVSLSLDNTAIAPDRLVRAREARKSCPHARGESYSGPHVRRHPRRRCRLALV